jgi:hypothetical protein
MHDTASATTATSTDMVLPTRIRLSARTNGATNKLSMTASTSGISTERPRYKIARTIPAVTMRLL